MTLIDGIGDEVTHFFIALCLTVILTVAWWTTNTSDQRSERSVRAVVLLDRRTHRRSQQLTNHTESATISEGINPVDVVNSSSEETEPLENMNVENKPPEASTSEEGNDRVGATSNIEEEEQIAIVETMDNQACMLRQRRLAFYESHKDNTESSQNASPSSDCDSIQGDDLGSEEIREEGSSSHQNNDQDETASFDNNRSNIRIKLKYINDDLKLVDGSLQEQLGNFKRRHFEGEISANKLVRLIFNGQVLQQDSATLESCGLFDNCVVHCLVHPRRINPNEDVDGSNRNERFLGSRSHIPQMNNNNNQGREWDLGNLLFALISFILGSAWYFRYVYAHLYTITATVALVAVTGIFTVVLIGMYFPEHHEPVRQQHRAE